MCVLYDLFICMYMCHLCYLTHSYVFIRAIRLIHMYMYMAHSYLHMCVLYDLFMCIYMCYLWYMTHSYVFIRAIRLIHMYIYMAHSYVYMCYIWLIHMYTYHIYDSFICIHTGYTTHSYVTHMNESCVHMTWLIHMAFVCATRLIHVRDMAIHTCDMAQSYVWCEIFMYMTWLIHICDMAGSYVWRSPFT